MNGGCTGGSVCRVAGSRQFIIVTVLLLLLLRMLMVFILLGYSFYLVFTLKGV